MDFSSICRTCLATKCLNPIFKDEEHHSRYSVALLITTGLKVEMNDGLPQKMCKNCMKILNDSLRFREQSKKSEILLLSIKNHRQVQDSELKDFKLHTGPYLKRKSNENSKNDCINIKIERDLTEKDDEIPLKNLFKNATDVKYQNIEVETQFKQTIVEHEQGSNEDFRNNSNKTDELIEHSSIPDDLKYEVEFLDPDFESNSETETVNIDSKSLNDVTNTENIPFIVRDMKRVTCKLCQKDLSRRSIDTHMAKRHPGADTRKVKCDLCDTYVLRQKLNRHKTIMHGRDSFKCRYCKTEYDIEEMLIDHVPACTAKRKRKKNDAAKKRKEVKVECDICHKMMQKASLRMHKEIKHAGMGPVCEHCGRRFGNKFRLNEHLRAKHGYEKFKCSECDFRSASSMAMRNHERRHRGERPFACEACGASFHAPHLLAQHKQSHRTEKLMKCNLCPAAFKANNTLHMHKITCHNAHTYQCSMCPRTYRCRHYAVKHLRNVHRYTGPVGALQRGDAPGGAGGAGDGEEHDIGV